MKYVIDIPEGMLDELRTCKFPIQEAYRLCLVIENGTPLPKGHGDLIDRNELEECKEIMNTITGESKYAVRMDDIRNMQTIIEADKEGAEDGKND